LLSGLLFFCSSPAALDVDVGVEAEFRSHTKIPQLGELETLRSNPSVDISASCWLIMGDHNKKLKCTIPPPLRRTSALWGNFTSHIHNLYGTEARHGCKAKQLKPSAVGSSTMLLLGDGRCSLSKKIQNAIDTGYSGIIVGEDKKSKVKLKPGSGRLTLPVVFVKAADLSLLQNHVANGDNAMVRVVLVARKRGPDGAWRDANTMYNDAKRLYLSGNAMLNSAIEMARWAQALDGRAYPLQYTLANWLFERGALTQNITKLPISAQARDQVISVLGPLIDIRRRDPKLHGHCFDDTFIESATLNTAESLVVVTVATDERYELEVLRASINAALPGVPLEVLGLGQTYPGLGFKIQQMGQWVESVPDDKLILFIDAYDVVFTQAAAQILQQFFNFCAPIVMGAEKECNPDFAMQIMLQDEGNGKGKEGQIESTIFPFLNSGTWIGHAAAVKRMFKLMAEDIAMHYSVTGGDLVHLNDQRWFTRYHLMHPEEVALDAKGELFHTLHWTQPSQFRAMGSVGAQGTVHSSISNTTPCVLHGNGDDGKPVLDALTQMLADSKWLDLPDRGGRAKYKGW